MSVCAIIGDSIALGLAMANPQCDYNARVGRQASVIAQQRMPGYYQWAVISAGSNNPNDPQLRAHLYRIRKNLNAGKVIWVSPNNARGYRIVNIVAVVFGDKVVRFKPAKDGVHPKSYNTLSKDIKKKL